jgi:hypothetical protein
VTERDVLAIVDDVLHAGEKQVTLRQASSTSRQRCQHVSEMD